MEFWIIENGEKRGPIADYTLREMIREEKVTPETRVWYEGAEDWEPAREINILAREFENKPEEKKIILTPPPIKISTGVLVRRFGARVIDFSLSLLLFAVLLRFTNFKFDPQSEEPISAWFFLAQFAPALILEGILIYLYGCTPGKYFMALHVETKDGKRLGLGASVTRSIRVWVLGLGMGMPHFAFIGHAVALWMIKKKGAPIWDFLTGYRVKSTELSPLRLGFYFLVLIGIWMVVTWALWPSIAPELEKTMEEARPHLLS